MRYVLSAVLISLISSGCERIEFKNEHSTKTRVTKETFPRTFGTLPTLITDYTSLSAHDIIVRAHQAAGGESWTRPKSLSMGGYAVFYKNGQSLRHETHKMWRVYDSRKTNAHKVDGKVRIYSVKDGEVVINISYDGHTTYTDKGAQPKTAADNGWSSNFGFGVIRHALDPGYRLERLPDDLIDGKPSFMIKVFDLSGGETQFGIGQKNFEILKVGFDTARGWHERVYSDFYSNSGDKWVQPGRVRLYYDGIKSNEVIWEKYAIDYNLPDCLFVLPQSEDCAG